MAALRSNGSETTKEQPNEFTVHLFKKNNSRRVEIKVSLREANMHFRKKIMIVQLGQQVVVTERGTPITVLTSS
jgi:flagellar basal body-associated protein FliL